MSPRASMLGRAGDRVKTDLRLPRELVGQVEAVCNAIGVPKNAFFAMSAAMLSARMSPILSDRDQVSLLDEMDGMFKKVMREAKRSSRRSRGEP